MSTIVEKPTQQAKVIMINGRYFYEFGKQGQVKTAWSIAGARTFTESGPLASVLKRLDKKKKKYTVEQIELVQRLDCYPPKALFKLRYRLERMCNQSSTYQTTESGNCFLLAKANLVEQVALTTMQLKVAERNNSKHSNDAVEWYFLVDFKSVHEELPIAKRLELYKTLKSFKGLSNASSELAKSMRWVIPRHTEACPL
ncbi:hypothetical protein [Vibrio splendidus]|uniref:hypothetical protein n=1 Tax=Vibrio splendidus TaxID=29497 RepID=UPI000CB7875A|nr:hypothetical protein [Vibrio splendidus]PMN25936.1 hypothetical protein BCT36_11320 [Vibrio splendidus]